MCARSQTAGLPMPHRPLVAREAALNDLAPSVDRTDDAEEHTLTAAAVAGDRRAFAALYERYLDAVYRYCYFRLRSVTEAEDMTADVFHRALVAMPRYQPRRPFLAFLYTIARNALIDHWRVARAPAPFEDALDHPTEEACPEASAVASDEAATVRAAIQRLPPLQQEIVVLRFIEGRSTRDIAAVTGKNESTIRGIQMRALHGLRAMLEAQA
jgi:RNA polymerase sigma-70 factor (ECF subfamily)